MAKNRWVYSCVFVFVFERERNIKREIEQESDVTQ